MPACLLITLAAVVWHPNRIRMAGAAIAGFLIPMVLLLAWLQTEPDTLRTIASRYGVGGGSIRNAFRYFVIQRRLSLFWAYFDPVYLFLVGRANVSMSTGKAGVFLLSGVILLPVGIYDAVRRRDARVIVLGGFLLSPLAPVLIDAGNAVQRSLVMVAFGAVLIGSGASALLSDSRRWVRVTGVVLVAAMPVQWLYFARDYFSDYTVRAAGWIDPTYVAGAMPAVLSQEPSRVYVSESLDDGEARWRFQLAKFHRDDLWKRTWIVEGSGMNAWSVQNRLDPVPVETHPPPPGSVFIVGVTSPAVERLTRAGACCTLSSTVTGAAGQPVLAILRPR